MTLSKTTEYALRVLSFMADDSKKMYSSSYLHKQLKIPKKYLQRLLTGLSKNGLIKSIQGRNGGYVFAKKIERIYLADIIDATEGFSTSPSCFFGFKKCALDEPCAMHDVWASTQQALITTLSTTRLIDLKNKNLPD
jgi:Rrf2 family transcriptional regulator, iron-sulfur cluster assembly transcription factor